MGDISYTISVRGKNVNRPILAYLREHFNHIALNSIDSVFGFVEHCTLYGGRPFNGRQLSEADIESLYDEGIFLRLPMTNSFVTYDEYKSYKWLFFKYAVRGNSVIVTDDNLAYWIREDFPLYTVEASVIKNIITVSGIETAKSLYDYIILPMYLNLKYDILESIPDKSIITLFGNAGCAFNCPNKLCYELISKGNKFNGPVEAEVRCSKSIIPRHDYGMVNFDIARLHSMGFNRFKMLRTLSSKITNF